MVTFNMFMVVFVSLYFSPGNVRAISYIVTELYTLFDECTR